jgi:hypothetical protein
VGADGLRACFCFPNQSRHHEDKMRAETEALVNEIKESLSLLRRHL